jgi:hypothetical protein
MTRSSLPLAFLVSLLTLGLPAAPGHADQARSFVSGLGSDANAPDCTRTAPCRTFQTAHDHTLPRGEIAVLDAGSYGAVTITKNISIINDGVGEAGALVSGGANGITINAPANAAVSLRGLTIKGIGFGGGNGIVFNTGLSLTIENCVIRNMTATYPLGQGLQFFPNASSVLAVSNSQITDNENGGIHVLPSGAGITVNTTLEGVGLYNNGFGFAMNGANSTGLVVATVKDSVAANNAGPGIWAFSAAAQANTAITVTNSMVSGNVVGLRAESTPLAIVAIGASALTNNGTNLLTFGGGFVLTFGDNHVFGNISNNVFSGAPIALQ